MKRNNDPNAGIILDEKLSQGLLGQLYLDHVIEPLGEVSPDPYKKSRYKKKALQMLLLYDRVHLYAFTDGTDFKQLVDYDIIRSLDPEAHIDEGPRHRHAYDLFWGLTDAEAISVMYFRSIIKPAAAKIFKEAFPTIRFNNDVFSRVVGIMIGDKEAYRSVERLVKQEGYPIVGSMVFIEMFVAREIRKVVADLTGMLAYSSDLSVPVASALVPHSRRRAGSVSLGRSIEPSIWQAYRIWLDEVEYLPRLENTHQVLDLRTDKRIRDFRQTLRAWSEEIRRGNALGEERMRREIRKANRELRHLRTVQRVAAWTTIISLPAALVQPLSLALTAVGTGVQIYSDIVERKHRWLLLGR